MNIVVCLKQVPNTADVRIDPETNTLIREGIPNIVNPFDLYAIEEGVRLREKFGGKVTALSMGPPQATEALREAMGMGVDEGILLSDRAFAGSDSWATSYTLALAIRKLGAFDVILCGKQAIDGDTGQVGPGIARQLGITPLTYVFRIHALDPAAGTLVVERLLEEGHEMVEAALPALLTVVKDINQPRAATLYDLRRAFRVGIRTWNASDLPDADPASLGLSGSPTQVVRIFSPPGRKGTPEIFSGEHVEEAASLLADRLLAEHVL